MANQLSGLKGRMVQEVEKIVNDIRKRRQFIQEELVQLESQEQEAREMMQLLRAGQVPTTKERKKRAKPVKNEDYLEAISVFNEAEFFMIGDIVDLVGASRDAVNQKLMALTVEGLIERVERGKYRVVKRTEE